MENMEKEPSFQSVRFRLFITGLVLEGIVAVAPQLEIGISQDIAQTVAIAILGLFGIMIHSRTQRNTK